MDIAAQCLIRRGLLTLLVVLASHAHAAIVTVGGDVNCSHATVQSAINALPSGGVHEVRIANTATYTAQAIQLSGRSVFVRGGYANCAAGESTGTTTLNGSGGSQDSVLTIRGSNNDVILENLALIRGDEVYDGFGGGIDFKGRGYLTLRRTAVTQNYAGYGGGISFIADGGAAELRLEAGSAIVLNTAQFSGGGIHVEGNALMTMLGEDSSIASNEALGFNPVTSQPQYGHGGGLHVIAPAIAEIGSPGTGTSGVIVGNTARYGGGIAVNARDNADGKVTLFSVDPLRPVRVYGNRATNTGGGVWLATDTGVVDLSRGLLCAYDARIDGNRAVEGSAIYADTDSTLPTVYFGTAAAFNVDSGYPAFCRRPAAGRACSSSVECNTIEGNRTENANGQPTAGAAILIQNAGKFEAARVRMRGNTGAYAARAYESLFTLDNALLTDNAVSAELIRMESEGAVSMVDSTLAGNIIGAAQGFSVNGDFELTRSILWQPGKTSLVQSDGTRTTSDVIASEISSLGGATVAVSRPPRFFDPATGDYRPHAASPAIDFSLAVAGDDRDIDGRPRDLRQAMTPRPAGRVRDIGAHERQAVLPLVVNSTFDGNLGGWLETAPGVSSWDGTQNALGPTGSGSTKVTQANTSNGMRIGGPVQCIYLPGPGTYALNGSGRSGVGGIGNRDYLYLNWQYRRAGGDSCTGGTANASGDHFVSNSSSWSRPANPRVIEVPANEWTESSSIAITMIVTEVGIVSPSTTLGWFDGITLEPAAADRIFTNGFEPF